MKKNILPGALSILFCSAILFLLFAATTEKNDSHAYQIVKDMFAKSRLIHSMKYVMRKEERIEGKMVMQQSSVKLISHPLKVYLKQELPKKGLEVLYVQGTNNNNALVNTNGFPWVNLNLDPMGNIMRENQHHTIFESGYPHLMSILEHLTAKYNQQVEGMVSNGGLVNWNGHQCWTIVFNNPHFKIEKYTVKPGETVLSIAAKSKLSEYMILELNKGLDGYNDLKAGQVINLPNDYSPKLELWVEKNELIPLVIKVYDDKGLYEHYEYHQVVTNPVFKSDEFEKGYSEYNF
jgi:outer membrane lipoprotein-sorting protein